MKIVFGYTPGDVVHDVFWKEGSEIMQRTLKTDGSVSTRTLAADSLSWVVNRFASSAFWVYPAEVGDLRTAFKYLGKDPQLIEVLPEVEIGPGD